MLFVNVQVCNSHKLIFSENKELVVVLMMVIILMVTVLVVMELLVAVELAMLAC